MCCHISSKCMSGILWLECPLCRINGLRHTVQFSARKKRSSRLSYQLKVQVLSKYVSLCKHPCVNVKLVLRVCLYVCVCQEQDHICTDVDSASEDDAQKKTYEHNKRFFPIARVSISSVSSKLPAALLSL